MRLDLFCILCCVSDLHRGVGFEKRESGHHFDVFANGGVERFADDEAAYPAEYRADKEWGEGGCDMYN